MHAEVGVVALLLTECARACISYSINRVCKFGGRVAGGRGEGEGSNLHLRMSSSREAFRTCEWIVTARRALARFTRSPCFSGRNATSDNTDMKYVYDASPADSL